MPASTDPIRLLVVEDVPQVAQYIRGLLAGQQHIRLLEVLTDGREAVARVGQLRPDVLIVDALLQGRVKGLQVVEQVREAGLDVPIVVLTVPQRPIRPAPERGIDRVLSMPFSGFDLINVVQALQQERAAESDTRSLVVSVFSPKGGTGKTTVAFNLAVGLAQLERRVVLVDGSLQFADLRALLRVPAEAPSILQLPTDRVQESDLAEVVWRDPSGIDILLAPPRVEMAEMVTARDVEKVLSLLRRVYEGVVIGTPSTLTETVLAFLDGSDAIIEIVTYESTTLHNARSVGETFRAIGYPPEKLRYLVNRADSMGGMEATALPAAVGREADYEVVSDGRLVVESNNQGLPFVLVSPAARISRDVMAIAEALVGAPAALAPSARA